MQTSWRKSYGKRSMVILVVLASITVVFFAAEILYIRVNGTAVPAPNIPREVQTYGEGGTLRYVVLGDSTSIGQGTIYTSSIAVRTALYLSQERRVEMLNVGVSGARMNDVATKQLPKALAFRPDVALVSAGANDVTHLTSANGVERDLRRIIKELRSVNKDIVIVITGAPDMSSPNRFPEPIRSFAGIRTDYINRMFLRVTSGENVRFAKIAQETGVQTRRDPTTLAPDKFHPNAKGYDLWVPVIVQQLRDL